MMLEETQGYARRPLVCMTRPSLVSLCLLGSATIDPARTRDQQER